MATEFTVWTVPKGTKTEDMPFFGLEKAEIVFNERHPNSMFHELIDHVRTITECNDEYVKVPEEHYSLIAPCVEKFDAAKNYVLSCL